MTIEPGSSQAYFSAFSSRFSTARDRSCSSAQAAAGRSSVDFQPGAPLLEPGAEADRQVVDDPAEVDPPPLAAPAADPAQLQEVVDQPAHLGHGVPDPSAGVAGRLGVARLEVLLEQADVAGAGHQRRFQVVGDGVDELLQLVILPPQFAAGAGEAAIGGPAGGHVAGDQRGADDEAPGVADRREAHGQLGAATVAAPVLDDPLAGRLAPERRRQQVGHDVEPGPGPERRHRLPLDRLGRLLEEAGGPAVPGGDRPLEVEPEDRVVPGVDDRRQVGVAVQRPAQLVDVLEGAGDQRDPAVGVGLGGAADPEPAGLIAGADADGHVELAGIAEGAVQGAVERLDVVGVEPLPEGLPRTGRPGRGRVVAEQGPGAGREPELAAADVPLPEAVGRAADGPAEAFDLEGAGGAHG